MASKVTGFIRHNVGQARRIEFVKEDKSVRIHWVPVFVNLRASDNSLSTVSWGNYGSTVKVEPWRVLSIEWAEGSDSRLFDSLTR